MIVYCTEYSTHMRASCVGFHTGEIPPLQMGLVH